MWSLDRHQYVLLAGLVWAGLGVLPVIFLVNHPPDPYYLDFALPGFALAVGAACELAAEGLSVKVAVAIGLALLVALGVVGNVVSSREFTREFGPDTAETQRRIAQVGAHYPKHPMGTEIIVVHSNRMPRDAGMTTARGDLFRVAYDDPSLRVELVP